MSIVKEFQEFAVKGNVVDMAVGVIIGAAFGGIVTSLVNDVVMPPIGYMLGGVDFANLQVVLKEAVGDQAAVSIKYGMFINKVINFMLVTFSMFVVIKGMNNLNELNKKVVTPKK